MEAQSQINSGAKAKVKITAKDFAAKMRTKQEVYHFLTHEAGAYLSSYDTMTVWHMKDLVSGKRRRIKGTDVKHLNVPQYDGLKIEAFYEFAKNYTECMLCFPLEKPEMMKLPRQYVINVIYTKVGQPFRNWVDSLVNQRHEEVAESKELYIEMDPEIAEIYEKSKAVSTSQGSSYNLMKACSKRRRSKKQIEEEKKQEELRQADIAQKLAQFEEMEQRIGRLQQAQPDKEQISSFVDQLKLNGLIRTLDDGTFEPCQNLEQVEFLKRQRIEESQNSDLLRQQMAAQADQGPSEERRRAGNQLEMNDEAFMQSQPPIPSMNEGFEDTDEIQQNAMQSSLMDENIQNDQFSNHQPHHN